MKQPLFFLSLLLLMVLFLYTGTSKLLAAGLFSEQLRQVPRLQAVAGPLAVLLPPAELATGAALLFPFSRRAGLLAAALLLTAFSIYTAWMLSLPAPSRPCSCGGVLRQLSWRQHLWFNLFFTVLAWRTLYLSCTRKRESAENP